MDSYQYLRASLPDAIKSQVGDYAFKEDTSGCSGACVYRLSNGIRTLYLKIEKDKPESAREHDMLGWLQSKLLVPQIISSCTTNGNRYLLTTKAIGEPATSGKNLKNSEQTTKLLADGIKQLQSVDTIGCPYNNLVDNRLRAAKSRVKKGLVDMSDWNDNTNFRSPEKLFEYLDAHRPEEIPSFTHGDYCFPNVFFANNAVSGFIDLGRAGIADIWQDIALCIRSMHHNFGTDKYDRIFFEHLGLKPNNKKIEYYILLDELF